MLTVRLLLALYNIHKIESKSIDFVLDFTQADLEVDICMELPIRFIINEFDYGHSHSCVLKLNKILYRLKQASLNWYEKLLEGLIARDFVPSVIDPWFYLKYGMMILTYVEDCIISGTFMKDIDSFIFSMQHGSEISFWPTREILTHFWGLKSLRMKIPILNYLNLFWSTNFYPFLVCAIMNIKRMQTSQPLLLLKVFYIDIWQASHTSCHGNIERLSGCYPISKAIIDPTLQWQFTKLLSFAMILG